MGFMEVIGKAKERYEKIKSEMEEKQKNKRSLELKKLKEETEYYSVKAKHQKTINKYEKLKKANADMKSKGGGAGERIKKNFEKFSSGGGGLKF